MKIAIYCESEGCEGLDFTPEEIVFSPKKDEGTVEIIISGAKLTVSANDFEDVCRFFISRNAELVV